MIAGKRQMSRQRERKRRNPAGLGCGRYHRVSRCACRVWWPQNFRSHSALTISKNTRLMALSTSEESGVELGLYQDGANEKSCWLRVKASSLSTCNKIGRRRWTTKWQLGTRLGWPHLRQRDTASPPTPKLLQQAWRPRWRWRCHTFAKKA